MLDAGLPDGRRHEALHSLADGFDAPEHENIVALELGRDADTSHHLVSIRDREPLHRHDRSAVTVLLLRGGGRMILGDEERPVGEGSLLYVPRATAHAFLNDEDADEPAIAYVVFSPPMDPEDRVPVHGSGPERE